MLKISDVASDFGVTYQTVRTWINKGLLPVYRIGGTVRINESEYEKFKESMLVNGGKEK